MIAIVRLLLVAVLTNLLAGAACGAPAGHTTYESTIGWAFDYDSSWTLEESRHSLVIVRSPPPGHGLVTITPLVIPPETEKGLVPFVDQLRISV